MSESEGETERGRGGRTTSDESVKKEGREKITNKNPSKNRMFKELFIIILTSDGICLTYTCGINMYCIN